MLTFDEALNLKPGQYIYSTLSRDFQGNPSRLKITSVKTWKTRPRDCTVKWKWGLKVFGTIDYRNGVSRYESNYTLSKEKGTRC